MRELLLESEWREGARPLLGVAPPATALDALLEACDSLPLIPVAQNCHWELSGAFTGEISPEMLAEIGCRMVIVGHSERRHVFGETDHAVGRKVAAVRAAGMTPILCVGETGIERESGRTEITIESQLRNGLGQLKIDDPSEVVVAYEPVWAIGTGKVATPDQAQTAHGFLRGILSSVCGPDVAAAVRILYGGSVKAGNAAELSARRDVDGFLVGGASLDPRSFLGIAEALS
jgi:triosephosphate isomerase